MHTLQQILKLLPTHISKSIAGKGIVPEEIRLRCGQVPVIRTAGKEIYCGEQFVTQADLSYLVCNATNGAYHAYAEYLAQGYIPLSGGGRMGISGEGSGGQLRNSGQVSSVCIRIARQMHGCADGVLPAIAYPEYQNTIIIAPPGYGKTTILREVIRSLSNIGYYIAVADTRGEISGAVRGQRGFDLGPRTDVTIGISKKEAALMMLRSMSPDILAMDEITAFYDMDTILEAVGCGVGLLTTIHGGDISALYKPGFREIYELRAFQKAVIISLDEGQRVYQVEDVYA